MDAPEIWSSIPRIELPATPPPVSAVCDVLGGDARLLDPGLRPVITNTSLMGQAVTTQLAPGDNLGVHIALGLAQPGDVLIVACSDEPSGAAGGIIAASAKSRGLAGLVTDGWVRDIANLREIGLPVWSRSVSPCGAQKRRVRGVNVPVRIGGVEVSPGDVIVADDDGIVSVPRAVALDVIRRAHEHEARGEELLSTVWASRESTLTLLGIEARFPELGVIVHEGTWERDR